MSLRIVISVAALATFIACDKMDSPAAPTDAAAALPVSQGAQSQSHERHVTMNDNCDSETFNAVLGPGGCVGHGGVTFDNFIALLTRMERVPSWYFSPQNATARVGDEFVVVNRGGETHTFTEVEEYGGGRVASLNALMHLSTVAPECANLPPGDLVPAGGTFREDISEAGLEKYQCCIHPWMRLEARIK